MTSVFTRKNDRSSRSCQKLFYFRFTFMIEKLGKWITELSIRAISITKEYIIEFDEFQDFYVSKFFDKYNRLF